jgi:hypothetical protein
MLAAIFSPCGLPDLARPAEENEKDRNKAHLTKIVNNLGRETRNFVLFNR